MSGFAHLEVSDGVGVVRLNRPPANAIDLQMGLELQEAIGEAGGRDDVGALVLWGGRKIFAAGADVKAMAEWGPDEVRPSVEALGAACDLLEALPKVSIAAVNGYALGGGMELALAADLRYLAEDAKLGQPEITLGVIPGAGGTQRLTRLVGPGRARELILTGRQIGSAEAAELGLSAAVVPHRRRPRCGRRRGTRVRARAPRGARGRQGIHRRGGERARSRRHPARA